MDDECFGISEYGNRRVYDFESNSLLKSIISFEDIQLFLERYFEKVLSLHRVEIESGEIWHVIVWQRIMNGAGFPPSKWPGWFMDAVGKNAFPERKTLKGRYGDEFGKAKQKAENFGTLLFHEIVRNPRFGKKYESQDMPSVKRRNAREIVAKLLYITEDAVKKRCEKARREMGGRPKYLDTVHLIAYPFSELFQ